MTSRNNFLPCWCTSESFDQPLTTCKHSQWNDFYWESSISSPDPDSLQEKILPWSRSCFDQIGTLRTLLPFTGWRGWINWFALPFGLKNSFYTKKQWIFWKFRGLQSVQSNEVELRLQRAKKVTLIYYQTELRKRGWNTLGSVYQLRLS